MGKLSKDKEEALAFIDSILTMLEMEENSFNFSAQLDISISPMKFLLEILNRLGVSNDEIVEFIANYLIYAAPVLELTIKALLLSQLRSNIDCNNDPRIPKKYREQEKSFKTHIVNNVNGEGFTINLRSIDYKGLFNLCPISPEGRFYYFGTSNYFYIDGVDEKFYSHEQAVNYAYNNGIDENKIQKYAEVENVEELIRANDFNAFLWYVFNRCKIYKSPTEITTPTNGVNCYEVSEDIDKINVGENEEPNQPSIGSVYRHGNMYGMVIKSYSTPLSSMKYLEDATSHVISKTVSSEKKEVENKLTYTLVPYGNVLTGLNWYVNRRQYFNFNIEERNYKDEFALFNVAPVLGESDFEEKINIRIKAEPKIYIPKLEFNTSFERNEGLDKVKISYAGDSLKTTKRILFNSQGQQDSSGRFSVDFNDDEETNIDGIRQFGINGGDSDIKFNIDTKTGNYFLSTESESDITSVLYECYPGRTVYEFNYDMVMGIKFFDPKVLAAQLIESITNISIGVNFDLFNSSDSFERVKIRHIIDKWVKSENTSSFSDCFYTFSNEEYEAMLNESELKRASLYPFNVSESSAQQVNGEDILNILNEYKDSPKYDRENVEVLSRSFQQAMVTIGVGYDNIDKNNIQKDFILNCVEAITMIFIEALLSPKLFMIMEMNNQIMGNDGTKTFNEDFLIEDFLKEFGNVIGSFINEIKDLILKHLFNLVEEKIKELLEGVARLLLKEQIEYYTRLMNALLKACRFSRRKSKNIDTELDNVDYADIDEVTYNGEEC